MSWQNRLLRLSQYQKSVWALIILITSLLAILTGIFFSFLDIGKTAIGRGSGADERSFTNILSELEGVQKATAEMIDEMKRDILDKQENVENLENQLSILALTEEQKKGIENYNLSIGQPLWPQILINFSVAVFFFMLGLLLDRMRKRNKGGKIKAP
jgi:hypothetical protein